MNGQLWQECPVCDSEPVCSTCELCETHCRCAADARDRREIRKLNKQQSKTMEKAFEHLEQGAQEH